ncbi:MAG: Uma2 family endonuclease [Intrasporangium sp.]|uniref:Uma2 family endonuclease n=1 Tax=Intrasporangium sp. TaxID=1925024 RepID=UPI002649BDE1|nr:Uma2 family endonuclease [Intrasporangium sp.]MDN5794854.1 Uma2 family endonuclease [Intrasporangium sp.]
MKTIERGRPFTAADLDALPFVTAGARVELVDGSLLVHGTFTRADLDAMPEDGRRYELLDGMLVVTPAPSFRHQRIVGELYPVLRAACPPGLHVLFAPFDVALAEATVTQPDLLVAPREAFTAKELPVAPLLAVEVLSSSTRRIDLGLKRERHERAGTASYWVIDPSEPSLIAWQLDGGRYVEVGHAVGEETFEASQPFPVRITPARWSAEMSTGGNAGRRAS